MWISNGIQFMLVQTQVIKWKVLIDITWSTSGIKWFSVRFQVVNFSLTVCKYKIKLNHLNANLDLRNVHPQITLCIIRVHRPLELQHLCICLFSYHSTIDMDRHSMKQVNKDFPQNTGKNAYVSRCQLDPSDSQLEFFPYSGKSSLYRWDHRIPKRLRWCLWPRHI